MAKKKSSLTKALQHHQTKTNTQLGTGLTAQKRRQEETKQTKTKNKNKNNKTKQLNNHVPPMLNKNDRILLVGEGNFSFTLMLVVDHLHPARLITASTIDSKETVLKKYPESKEILKKLQDQEKVTILFELDACKLKQDKRIKIKKFDKVIFNFPHVGGSESNQSRSVIANQILILRFLRSVPHVLFQSPSSHPDHILHQISSKSKSNIEHDDDDDDLLDFSDTISDSLLHHHRQPGCVLITTGTCPPYSLWDVPKLAKKGKTLAHTLLYPTHPNLKLEGEQPNYKILRSMDFDSFIKPPPPNQNQIQIHNSNKEEEEEDKEEEEEKDKEGGCIIDNVWNGRYQHRQTNGIKSSSSSLVVKDSRPTLPRTWLLQLL